MQRGAPPTSHNFNGAPGALLPLALPLGFGLQLDLGRAALRRAAAQGAGRTNAAAGGGADHLAHAVLGGAQCPWATMFLDEIQGNHTGCYVDIIMILMG